MTTENEKIALKLVEGCTHVYPKSTGSCRFCTSEALDAKDLTISQLKADVERLKENQSALQSGGILHNERMRIRKLESEKEALEKREHIDEIVQLEAKVKGLEEELSISENARGNSARFRDLAIKKCEELEGELRKAALGLRPFANMSECIENDKDFHCEGKDWIEAKKIMSLPHLSRLLDEPTA